MTAVEQRWHTMEPIGVRIRRQRRRLGLTLDELAGRASISKPYLSLIETGRVGNPPSDEKLRRLEQTLGFAVGDLLTQAHLQRTPQDVRAVLHRLMGDGSSAAPAAASSARSSDGAASSAGQSRTDAVMPSGPRDRDIDSAGMSAVLQELVERGGGERLMANAVPVINRVASGYPQDFSDMDYPPRVADEYLSCPDVTDPRAFAARVHGDAMTPKYQEGDIVIFSPALTPRDGDDCFIRFADGQTTFKRVFFETSEERQAMLRLQPRNERHRPQMLTAEKVAGMYKAVFRYQRVDE